MSDYATTLKTLERLEEDQLAELYEDLSESTIVKIHGTIVTHLMTLLDKWTADARKITEMNDIVRNMKRPSFEQDYKDVDAKVRG